MRICDDPRCMKCCAKGCKRCARTDARTLFSRSLLSSLQLSSYMSYVLAPQPLLGLPLPRPAPITKWTPQLGINKEQGFPHFYTPPDLPTEFTADYIEGWRTHPPVHSGQAECLYFPHNGPLLDCSCGFYAYATPVQAAADTTNFVIVKVRMWGRVIKHALGWRAQFMEAVGTEWTDQYRRDEGNEETFLWQT